MGIPDAKIMRVDTWDDAERLVMVASVNSGQNLTTTHTESQLHVRRSCNDQLLAIILVAEAE